MTEVKRMMSKLRLFAALGLLVSGLALAATAAPASAASAPGHTIATAGTLGTNDSASGGGGPIDFWKIHLNGGDVVQIEAAYRAASSGWYTFQLFAPGTNDGNFPSALAIDGGTTNGNATRGVAEVQAPYNGTFILAVCQDVNYQNCVNVDSGSGIDPMTPYTFTTYPIKNVSPVVAAKEVKASPVISGAKTLGIGNFEAGGGSAIDFWKVRLNGGDVMQLKSAYPAASSGWYTFQLYAPGTTDANFASRLALSGGTTNGNATSGVVDVRAPYNGTFVLAVCQDVNYQNCVNVDSGSGIDPMTPYTFTPTQIGGLESKMSLGLSAKSVTYGHEKSEKFSVTVTALYGGSVTGKARVSDGKKTVCTIKLTKGKGSCTLPSSKALAPGTYKITAYYSGNKIASKSGTGVLTVKK